MKQNITRILAILALICIVLFLGLTLFFAFTGNPNYWGMLALSILLPIAIFVIMLIVRLFQ